MKHIYCYISYCYKAVWLNGWFSIFTTIYTYLTSIAKTVHITVKVYRRHFVSNLMTNKCWFLIIFSKMSSKQNIFKKLFFHAILRPYFKYGHQTASLLIFLAYTHHGPSLVNFWGLYLEGSKFCLVITLTQSTNFCTHI